MFHVKLFSIALLALCLGGCTYTLKIDGLERKGFPVGNTSYKREVKTPDGIITKVEYKEDKKPSWTGLAAIAAYVFSTGGV